MPAQTTIRMRQGAAAEWAAADPVLAAGEQGYETDTGLTKIGDGSSVWTALGYANLSTVPMQSGFYYRTPSLSPGNVAAVANVLHFTPLIVPTTTTFDRVGAWSASTFTGTATLRSGIYSSVAGQPGNLLADSGPMVVSAQALTLGTISLTVPPGLYWAASVTQDPTGVNGWRGVSGNTATPTPGMAVSINGINAATHVRQTGVTGELPLTASGTQSFSECVFTTVRVA